MKGTPLGGGRRAARAGVGTAVAAIALAAAGPAAADKFEVTTTNADGQGSFSAAVKRANKVHGGDQISFERKLRGEIALPDQVTLNGKLTIKGNGYGDPADKMFRRLQFSGHRGETVLLVDEESNAVLRSLYFDGVALKTSRGDITVKDSFLRGDRTVDATGISAGGDELRVLHTTVEGYDRGIAMSGIDARIDRSTIADNVGSGGVYVGGGGAADVSNSTISGNVVSGGPVASGGGLSTDTYSASARVVNSTIVGNQAIAGQGSGGGLFGNVDVVNSTISGNRAATGAGVAGAPGADADVANSIIYGNNGFDGNPADCGTPFTSGGGNVIGTPGECLLDAQDRSGVDPLLGPLADNGGPTETEEIGAGSPAIGLAVKKTATDFDQRGVDRGADPDSGAYEREG